MICTLYTLVKNATNYWELRVKTGFSIEYRRGASSVPFRQLDCLLMLVFALMPMVFILMMVENSSIHVWCKYLFRLSFSTVICIIFRDENREEVLQVLQYRITFSLCPLNVLWFTRFSISYYIPKHRYSQVQLIKNDDVFKNVGYI